MSRNERQTCHDLIEPALAKAGWRWDAEVMIGPGRVNLSGEAMYDDTQSIIADYVLRLGRIPLSVLEAKAEGEPAADGMQQGSRYSNRLGLRFSIASNGREYILTDNKSGEFEHLKACPTPQDILARTGRNVDLATWTATFDAAWHEDQVTRKKVRPYSS